LIDMTKSTAKTTMAHHASVPLQGLLGRWGACQHFLRLISSMVKRHVGRT
jgi:hypothetical protein